MRPRSRREPRPRQRRPQIVGDVVADAGERVDHRFHLVEHAVDDDRELGERLVQPLRYGSRSCRSPATMRWTRWLTSSTRCWARTLSHAPASRHRQNAGSRPSASACADDAGDLRWPRRRCARSPARRHSACRLPIARTAWSPRSAVIVMLAITRLQPARRYQDRPADAHVARDPVPVGAEQPGKLNAARNPAADGPAMASSKRGGGSDPMWRDLGRDHAIGSRDQVAVDLPVDESEQRDDEDGEDAGHHEAQRKVFD